MKLLKAIRKFYSRQLVNFEADLKTLQKHERIGIDLDGTLLSGPYCKQIQAFVANSPATFVVISFRSSLDSETVSFLRQFKNIQEVSLLPRDIPEFSKEYLLWKGKMCKKHDCTALIDDDALAVMAGCLEYDIQLFNSLKWVQYRAYQ